MGFRPLSHRQASLLLVGTFTVTLFSAASDPSRLCHVFLKCDILARSCGRTIRGFFAHATAGFCEAPPMDPVALHPGLHLTRSPHGVEAV